MTAMKQLIKHWLEQQIVIEDNSLNKIEVIAASKNLSLPPDFVEFYRAVNGMVNLFPNDYDSEGFLFYPIQALTTMEVEFPNRTTDDLKNVIIFADYMLKCWWYGLKVLKDGTYEIGLIANYDSFNVITTSLNDFINLYLTNSETLLH